MTAASGNIEYTTPAIEAFYRQHRVRWEQFYESERVVLAELGLTAASSVLDIGCGCGGLGLALRERFGVTAYTGVEINRRAAATARLVYPAAHFVCGDLLTLPAETLPAASFDVVVSLGCIDWNVEFSHMLARAFSYVRPGGSLVCSFRLTPGESLSDLRRSYQYINFDGKREGEVAPYVVLNARQLVQYLTALGPARIRGYGYWGTPSPTAVTPHDKLVFAVMAVRKRANGGDGLELDLDLPQDLLATLSDV
jgi:SAM-dependent methyltransferase